MQNREKSHQDESKGSSQKYTYSGYSFTVPSMGKSGVSLTPKPYSITSYNYNSKIIDDLHSIWDLNKFKNPRMPLEVGRIADERPFHTPIARILDMPIKLAGSNEYKIPEDVIPFLTTIQMIVDHEHSILSERQLLSYYAYLTIDQSYVQAGTMQRKPGAHVDGFQGARISPKTIINHSYVVSNGTPTVFFPQSFNFSKLNERMHDFFLEMDNQADEDKAVPSKPFTVYLMDAYTVHRASLATQDCFRTFLRLSYDVKEFDRLGNTINPLFSYKWDMVPREVQSTLVRHQSLDDFELKLLNNFQSEILSQYLEKLKKSNLEHYYNFIYAGMNSKDINIVRLFLKNISPSEKPRIQELRLLFIVATQKDLEVAQLGKAVFIAHLKLAKQHIKSNLFLDFLLEVITQKPYLLSKRFLHDLVNGQENTPQGKDILKALHNVSNNAFYFWDCSLKSNNIFQKQPLPGQLRSKL